jgi:hypothetical protein
MNKKQVIRINESQLKRIVSESVKKVLNEIDWTTAAKASDKRMEDADQLWGKVSSGKISPEEQEKFNKYTKSFTSDRRIALEKLLSKYISRFPELNFKLAPSGWNGNKLFCDVTYKDQKPHFHMTVWADSSKIKTEVIESDDEGYFKNYPNMEKFATECPEMYEFQQSIDKELSNYYSNRI